MTIKSELLSLKHADPQNILHVEEAEQWARDNPQSDLHGALEWDAERGALQWRLQQIRGLVRLHIVNETGEPTMVSLSIDRVAGGGYRDIEDILPVSDLRAILLRDALAELERVQRKYSRVQELATVWEAAEAARIEAARPRTRRGARQRAMA